MTKRRSPRGGKAARGSKDIEWLGGILRLGAYVTGEGEPYRPEALLWMGPDGAILGTEMARPGEMLEQACQSLQATIEQPMWGDPHAPTRVRVASKDLADALRAGFPALQVACAPTPELAEVAKAMQEHLDASPPDETSYLLPQNEPEACASYCRAAAGLYRAKPWDVVPSDQELFSVSIPELGVHGAALSVIGQLGESRGFVLFSGLEEFDAYMDAARRLEGGENARPPAHLSLNFDRKAEIPPGLHREVRKHAWEVAGRNAYPWVVVVDEDVVPRPPAPRDLAVVEAIALAMPEVLGETKALDAAWESGDPVSFTLSVGTCGGEVEVTLSTPYNWADTCSRPPFGVLAELFDLAQGDEVLEADVRRPLEEALLNQFADAPEARGLPDLWPCRCVMDLAGEYFGATTPTLGPSDLRAILFEIIPAKVSVEASEARAIIEVNRAFYAFLKREFELGQADACLHVLGDDAVARLEEKLSDSSNFGMAKGLVMAGREAGFDMDTKEGLEAWMKSIQGKPLPPGIGGPDLGRVPRGADEAARRAKRKRKAARKSRRKNR